MDLQYELGRIAQVNQDIKVANARIAELASEASRLERVGQDVPKLRQRSSVAMQWWITWSASETSSR
jgi:hypothetical protein